MDVHIKRQVTDKETIRTRVLRFNLKGEINSIYRKMNKRATLSGGEGTFSIRSAMEVSDVAVVLQNWTFIVWFKGRILKHSVLG